MYLIAIEVDTIVDRYGHGILRDACGQVVDLSTIARRRRVHCVSVGVWILWGVEVGWAARGGGWCGVVTFFKTTCDVYKRPL